MTISKGAGSEYVSSQTATNASGTGAPDQKQNLIGSSVGFPCQEEGWMGYNRREVRRDAEKDTAFREGYEGQYAVQ